MKLLTVDGASVAASSSRRSVELLGRELRGRAARGEDLEREAGVERVAHELGRDRPHRVAAAADGHEPVADEARQGLVHRAARDAELVREALQAEALARAELPRDDPLAQPAVGLLVEVDAHEALRGRRLPVLSGAVFVSIGWAKLPLLHVT